MKPTEVTLKAGAVLADGTTLKQDITIPLPRLKFGVMGRPGGGKSRLVASLPKPLLVLATDPEEKLEPYFERCGALQRTVGQFGQPVIVGMSPTTGNPIMQIEIFYDEEPNEPQAFTSLLARSEQLRGEVNADMWASVGVDSWTQMETFAIWRRRMGAFAVKDADSFGRAHGAAYGDLAQLVMSRFIPLKCNLGMVFHTSEVLQEDGGVSFFGIKAGGKNLALATQLASLLPNRYRSVAVGDGVTRQLYTKPDGRYDLCTLYDASSPCDNSYPALWTNYISKKALAMSREFNQPAVANAAPQEGETK